MRRLPLSVFLLTILPCATAACGGQDAGGGGADGGGLAGGDAGGGDGAIPTGNTDPAWPPDVALPAEFDFPPWVTMPAPNQIVISWRTVDASTGVVRYGTSPDSYDTTMPDSDSLQLHHVNLGVLAPATAYFYEVDIDGTSAVRKGVFVTPGMSDWRFIQLAETHFPSETDGVAKFADSIRAFRPHLIVESGDMVDDGNNLDHWRSYLRTSAPWISNVITTAAHSNHVNGSGGNSVLLDLFVLPDNERWYETRFGQIDFITVNSTYDTSNFAEITGAEETWLGQRVAATHDGTDDPALVVTEWHYPACSSNYASRSGVRDWVWDNLISTIADNGGVDMIMVGHDKYFERSTLDTSSGTIVHLQTNAGKLAPAGAGSNHAGCTPEVTKTTGRSMPFFTVSAGRIDAIVRDADGNQIDSFTVGS